MHRPATIRMSSAAIAAVLLLAACGSDDDTDAEAQVETEVFEDDEFDDEFEEDDEFGDDDFDEDDFDDEFDDEEGGFDEDDFDEGEFEDDAESDGEDEAESDDPVDTAGGAVTGAVDLSLTRDDIDCSTEGLGEDDETMFTDAHYVVGGVLGAACFGDGDPTLTEAWESLSVITPTLQLADLGVFGAFEGASDTDEITLAFVNRLDDDGTLFQMSINLESYREDSNEAQLTMAHEFSHVFTALPSQIDRSAESADNCTTFDNGEGCYLPDSLMAQWIALFWGDGLIDEIDPNVEASGSGGEDRCSINPGFLGAYAASSPEEDFAESFSAYVFQLDAGTDAVQAKLDWMNDQPGLAEFRDRAIAAGIGPLENNFDRCGEG